MMENNDVMPDAGKSASVENITPAAETRRAVDADMAVFALDVGTRTIAGVVGTREDDGFRIIAAETYEHDGRVMYDGQIHDIGAVAKAVAIVRDRLEAKAGFRLGAVYTAAAGRALKTVKVETAMRIPPGREIDDAFIKGLEACALKAAREAADRDAAPEGGGFAFVGGAITRMYLDGYRIISLSGHRGEQASVEFLAAFLPNAVTASLRSVMKRAGLEVAGITLEPMAALNAVAARANRHLNLALADVGAGTTDIAVTKDGALFGCSMVSFAGDNVTDCISHRFLTDFRTGEAIKYAIYEGKGEIWYDDIFNRRFSVAYDEAHQAIKPVVAELAHKIAAAILDCNKKAPEAVIIAGGGCRLPGLADGIAANRQAWNF